MIKHFCNRCGKQTKNRIFFDIKLPQVQDTKKAITYDNFDFEECDLCEECYRDLCDFMISFDKYQDS